MYVDAAWWVHKTSRATSCEKMIRVGVTEVSQEDAGTFFRSFAARWFSLTFGRRNFGFLQWNDSQLLMAFCMIFPMIFLLDSFFETSSFRGRWSYFDENTRACLVWLVELQVTKEWTGPRRVCSNAGSKKKHFKAVDHVLWEFCTTPHCNFECSNVLDMVGFWENMDFSSRNSRLLIFEPCTASLVMSCTLMHFRHGDQRGFSRWKSQ